MAKLNLDVETYATPNVEIHELIGEAMRKKDRIVLVNITKYGTSVTIQPMSEDAKWVEHDDGKPYMRHFQCSDCGQFVTHCSTYCPYCGTQMTGVKKAKKEVTNE
jgi:uncharacterized Fe-S center protein